MPETTGEYLRLKGGRVIDPGRGVDSVADVWVSDGQVAAIGDAAPAGPWEAVDVSGLCVCPGLIDIHVHLREPGQEHKETIATGSAAAVLGGYSTVCCMPNTVPPLATPALASWVSARARETALCRVRVIGAVDGPDTVGLAAAGCVALTDDAVPLQGTEPKTEAWVRCANAGLPLVVHCEDLALSRRGAINAGEVSRALGVSGQCAEAEAASLAEWLEAARASGRRGRLHVAHVSTRKALLVAAGAMRNGESAVTMETAPHYLALTEQDVRVHGANAKMNPPLRTEADRMALRAAVIEGAVGAIATDHAPHTPEEKAAGVQEGPYGVVGLETALGVILTELYHSGAMGLPDVIHRITAGPAQALGLADLGTLTVGGVADLTVFDPDHAWVVEPAQFASKGRNTPFAGARLRGKAWGVVVGGRLVSRDYALVPGG